MSFYMSFFLGLNPDLLGQKYIIESLQTNWTLQSMELYSSSASTETADLFAKFLVCFLLFEYTFFPLLFVEKTYKNEDNTNHFVAFCFKQKSSVVVPILLLSLYRRKKQVYTDLLQIDDLFFLIGSFFRGCC